MPYVTNYDVHLFLLPRILQRVWGGTLSKNKMCQLELAADFGYITMEDLNTLEVQYEEIANLSLEEYQIFFQDFSPYFTELKPYWIFSADTPR